MAKEESRVGFLSKLFFTWVDPLVVKAARGGLHQPDDVFDLPDCLSPQIVAQQVRRETDKLVKLDTNTATNPSQAGEVKLLTLLYNCYGREFFRIGFLKFLSDCAGFAGPILLNCVVSFMEDQVGERILTDLCNYWDLSGCQHGVGLCVRRPPRPLNIRRVSVFLPLQPADDRAGDQGPRCPHHGCLRQGQSPVLTEIIISFPPDRHRLQE